MIGCAEISDSKMRKADFCQWTFTKHAPYQDCGFSFKIKTHRIRRLQRFLGVSMRNVLVCLMLLFFTTLSFAKENKMSDTHTKVKLTTNLGSIVIQLDKAKAPVSAANFVDYVKAGFYEGTIFHRVIKGFMAQGGGFDTSFKQKATNAPIKNEADNGLKNKRGTIAMARTSDPQSATAQFFINLIDNDFLDQPVPPKQGWGYAVFGEVTEGMDVVDQMATKLTGSRPGGFTDVPKEDIVIEKAEIVE
jgi:peptidyl-prolyl cis-trans isomerase B (cyclophilin B)